MRAAVGDDAGGALTAATLRQLMKDVVDDGTGTAANVAGLDVAGKTGTAETGHNGKNTHQVHEGRWWLACWSCMRHPAQHTQTKPKAHTRDMDTSLHKRQSREG